MVKALKLYGQDEDDRKQNLERVGGGTGGKEEQKSFEILIVAHLARTEYKFDARCTHNIMSGLINLP